MPWSAPRLRRMVLVVLVGAVAIAAVVLHLAAGGSHRSIASGLDSLANSSASKSAVRAPQVAAKPEDKHILFVGASYTAGIGAEPHTNGYAYLTARALGWQPRIDAVPGSGYLNPGPPGDHGPATFADRLSRLSTTPAPDLLVLQGGRNDSGYPPNELKAAVLHTVGVAKSRFAHCRVVLLGPIPATLPPSRGEAEVAHVLRDVATSTGVVFVDPIAEGWITSENERGYVGDVPAHPDNAGYAYIAKRLVDDLDQTLGATPAASSANH